MNDAMEKIMSTFPFHVAGGVFCSGHSTLSKLSALPSEKLVSAQSHARRRKLWELSHKFHCPVIGVCFDCDELRRLMKKVMHLPSDASDFLLHTTAVGCCEERGRLTDILQKTLEKRCQLAVRQHAQIRNESELRVAWQTACKEGRNLPVMLWVCWTHPACEEQLAQEIYGDIHMIQHQLGAHVRVDKKAMQGLQTENAELQGQLNEVRAEIEELRQQKGAQANQMVQTIAQLKAGLIAKDAQIANITRISASLRETMPDAEAQQRLVQRLAEAELRTKESSLLVGELRQEIARLREFAKFAEETIESLTRDDDVQASMPESQLSGKCVLCVGGRSGAVNSYREVVEQSGGRFMHHDGGLEESLHRIDGALAAADIVICQAGCISHNAYWRVKEQCKRTGKPCVFVKNSGVSSFGRAVSELGRKP